MSAFTSPPRPDSTQEIDATMFRQVLGHFTSGITVVTAFVDGRPIGFTAQSFTSLSLDPPLVSLAPAKTSRTWGMIRRGGYFCVNVLSENQEEVSRTFARAGEERFRGIDWSAGVAGCPKLDGVLAWIECELIAEHDAGDHTLAVGKVINLAVGSSDSPLVFFRGGYSRLDTSG